ncbi:YdcF family protein [Hymenobacter sediminicola]|uniref:YdcF family protein n=1 Tax=Hymenobacter sediminicola TaxID=2761579 RepID=A0A7G7W2S3_9BACT|nr:YdcF family protein [Hymenobacter sediminicola]QNH60666.1 YdcF family protein [Hymenobacter sediminicola]
MFFLLSKVLDFLLLPVVWLLVLLVAALLTRRPGRQRRLLLVTLVLLVLGTNNALVNEALLAWELPPVGLRELPRHADAAILLTGITNTGKSPHDRVYLHDGADRLTNALWLWRAGRVRYILVSGGSGAVFRKAHTEAEDLITLLHLAGVPDSVLIREDKSRNTRENALFTQRIVQARPELDTLLLVTSAFHQRRALGCFARVGLQPQPFPAGFFSSNRAASPDYWLVPSSDALDRWSLLLHEISGYAVYKVLGYL